MYFSEMIKYVENVLEQSGNDRSKRHPFRSRMKHSKRVLTWAVRLCQDRTDVNTDVLYTAVIFHDIGYARAGADCHQADSAELFREYAEANGLDKDFIEKVISCIIIHSDKWRMENPEELSIEQLLLMEADLLDEEGALAICWDGLASGYSGVMSYEEALQHTRGEWADKYNHNPMVTYKAKQFWKQKQEFVKKYLEELEQDLQESSLL